MLLKMKPFKRIKHFSSANEFMETGRFSVICREKEKEWRNLFMDMVCLYHNLRLKGFYSWAHIAHHNIRSYPQTLTINDSNSAVRSLLHQIYIILNCRLYYFVALARTNKLEWKFCRSHEFEIQLYWFERKKYEEVEEEESPRKS